MHRAPLRIAVIVPAGYSGGTMRGALNTAIQIHDGAKAVGDLVRVELGYVDVGQEDTHESFKQLRARGIAYRPITVQYHPSIALAKLNREWLSSKPVAVFNDGVSNFDDADFLLVVSDRITEGTIAPTYRFGILTYDFIQRYVPAIFDGNNEEVTRHTWRVATDMLHNYTRAAAVFVTTEQAARDAVSYAGVRRDIVHLLPNTFEPPDEEPIYGSPIASDRKYILWTTNLTQHKNQIRALEGLAEFLRRRDDVDVVVTGVHTDVYSPQVTPPPHLQFPYVNYVRETIAKNTLLRRRATFLGNIRDAEYFAILKGAVLLFHPAIFDNGTFSVLEAAWYGVPSVSSRYAAMEEIEARFNLPLTYVNWRDPSDIARGLAYAAEQRAALSCRLPTREHLQSFARGTLAVECWNIIKAAAFAAKGQAPCAR